MESLIKIVLAILLLVFTLSSKVVASDNRSILDGSQISILNQYAERFCSAKADNFFEGLDSEKTLKYSYFKYIGLQSKEIFSKDMYESLIDQIKEKCLTNTKEEDEIKEFFLKYSKSDKN
tara:strand:+ start:1853 stop:2212 length:360 start_codon:yes stop_codon:yes gene_type:complete